MKKSYTHSLRKVSLSERHKAKRIIADLRRDYSAGKIADLFKIPEPYISFMLNLHMHAGSESYLAPHWAIEKVNQYGAMLGLRRYQNVIDDLAA